MKTKKYTITKRIAKHGNQSIIVIPSVLKEKLRPGVIVEITFQIIKEYKGNNSNLEVNERRYYKNE